MIMKKLWLVTLITILLMNCNYSERQKNSAIEIIPEIPENPFYTTFNQPIDFKSITNEDINEAIESIQVITGVALSNIISIKDEERTFDNTMRALDLLYANYDDIVSSIGLIASTHPDSVIRNNAYSSNTKLSFYINNVALNEDLYIAIKSYSQSAEAKKLSGYKSKFLTETVAKFERNGFALSKEDRERLKGIKNEISVIGDKFYKNIVSSKDFLIVDEVDIDGLPENYKETRKQDKGDYKIDLTYPAYRPFMMYCNSENARKALFMKYLNRAAPENLDLLQKLLQKRLEMSKLLGYETYSSYILEDRMARNPATVWEFVNNLKRDLKTKSNLDKEELLAIKAGHAGKSDVINLWEKNYYLNILLKENYQLDAEEVKQYFALDDVIKGLFIITQSLFDLEYKEVKNPSVWHEEVRMFEVYQDHKLKGIFYLDLHPRENKYNHAACFGIKEGRMTSTGYQVPNASLVCNFPRATADKPALMSHKEVNTLFHEFGHLLHKMLTTADLYSQSGTNVSQDFVEVPSQMLENWVWNYDAIKLFAKHYETREVMPKEFFNQF